MYISPVLSSLTKQNRIVLSTSKGWMLWQRYMRKRGCWRFVILFDSVLFFCAFLLMLLIYLVCFSLTPFEMFTFQKIQPFFRIFVFVILGAVPFGCLSPLFYLNICSFCLRFATIANIPFPHHFDFILKHTHVWYFRFYPFFNILHFKFILYRSSVSCGKCFPSWFWNLEILFFFFICFSCCCFFSIVLF